MTNTHINVGGHKITTNKMGEIKTITFVSGISGTGKYKIINGICFVDLEGVSTSTLNTWNTIANNLPKGIFDFAQYPTGFNTYYRVNNGSLQQYAKVSETTLLGFSYPVADDWVES